MVLIFVSFLTLLLAKAVYVIKFDQEKRIKESTPCESHDEIICPDEKWGGNDIHAVATSNLKFTLEMYKSLSLKKDTFTYPGIPGSDYGPTCLKFEYRELTPFSKTMPESGQCRGNGREDSGKNFLFSPLSLQMLMATVIIGKCPREESGNMRWIDKIQISYNVFPGIDVQSSKDLRNLGYRLKSTRIRNEMSDLIEKVLSKNRGAFYISNAMYLKQGIKMKSECEKGFKSYFKLDVEEINFSNSSAIHQIARKFQIEPQILLSQNLTNETEIVLFSQMSYNFTLKTPFEEKYTTHERFRTDLLSDVSYDAYHYVNTTMLNQEGYFGTCRLPNASAIRLDYKDDNTALIIILPDESSNLYSVQPTLHDFFVGYHPQPDNKYIDERSDTIFLKRLEICFEELQTNFKKMRLSVPLFHLDEEYFLKDRFQNLATEIKDFKELRRRGPWSIFHDQYESFLMFEDNKKKLAIKDIVHKTTFGLIHERMDRYHNHSEHVTLKTSTTRKHRLNDEVIGKFKCDRPFMFLLIDIKTGASLLSGRIINPTGSIPIKVFEPKNSTVMSSSKPSPKLSTKEMTSSDIEEHFSSTKQVDDTIDLTTHTNSAFKITLQQYLEILAVIFIGFYAAL